MGLRLTCTFRDQISGEYLFEMYDDNYSGAATEVKSTIEDLEYNGSTDELYEPIMAASFTIGILLVSGSPEYDAIEDTLTELADEDENRFWCTVSKTGSTQELFRGVLVIDEVLIPNADSASVSLTFVDGLSLLKEVEYKTAAGAYFDPQTSQTLWEHFQNCLSLLQTFERYLSTDNFIRVVFNWFHTGMVADVNRLNRVRVKHDVFTSVDDEGEFTAKYVWDVLEELLKPFLLVLGYDTSDRDAYFIVHYDTLIRTGTLPNGASYNRGFNLITNNSTARDAVAQDMLGGMFSFKKGLKGVNISYEYVRSGVSKFHTDQTEPLDYVSYAKYQLSSNDEKLILWGTLNTFFHTTFTIWKVFGLFNLYIKIVGPTKTVWWGKPNPDQIPDNNDFVDYGASFGAYYNVETPRTIETSRFNFRAQQHALNDIFVDVVTNPLSDEFNIGDELEVFIKFKKLAMTTQAFIVPNVVKAQFELVEWNRRVRLALIDGAGGASSSSEGLVVQGEFNAGNTSVLDYEMSLGFGQTSEGSNLEIEAGAGWEQASNKWKKTTGEYYLYELVLQDLHTLRSSTSRMYEGVFRGVKPLGFSMFTAAGIGEFFAIEGTHDIGGSSFSGKFIKASTFAGSPTIKFLKNSTSSGTSGNSGPPAQTVTAQGGSGQEMVKIPFKQTGIAGTTITVLNVVPIDDTDLENEVMEMFVYVKRNNTVLTYNKLTPERMEYNVEVSGTSTIINLGRTADPSETYTGWITKTD